MISQFRININIRFFVSNIKILDDDFILFFNYKNYISYSNNEKIEVFLQKKDCADFAIHLFFEYGYDIIKKLFKIVENSKIMEKVTINKDSILFETINYENKIYDIDICNKFLIIYNETGDSKILELKHPYNLIKTLEIFNEILENREFFKNYVYDNLKKIFYMLPVIEKYFVCGSSADFTINNNINEIQINLFVDCDEKNIGKRKYTPIFEYNFSRTSDFKLFQCLYLNRNRKKFAINLNYNNDLFNILINLIKNLLVVVNEYDYLIADFYFKGKIYRIYFDNEIWVKNEENELILQIPGKNMISKIKEFQSILKERHEIDKFYRHVTNYSFDAVRQIVNNLLSKFKIS